VAGVVVEGGVAGRQVVNGWVSGECLGGTAGSGGRESATGEDGRVVKSSHKTMAGRKWVESNLSDWWTVMMVMMMMSEVSKDGCTAKFDRERQIS
jgi:hypothetical protein